MSREKITRKAIAVYNPEDEWESAIQDAAKHLTGNWLPSYPCQMLAGTIYSLKLGTDWLDNKTLFPSRAAYFFSDYLINIGTDLVFVTQLLFLRDILENREINAKLHEPIAFMSNKLAYFLFQDCPVHIHINENMLRAANKKIEFINVGGFLIAKEGNIKIKDGVISNICYYGNKNKEQVSKSIDHMRNECGLRFMKSAAVEVDYDVYEIEEHFRDIVPGLIVWDKVDRVLAKIVEVEPGETGIVRIEYESGETSIPKEEFDHRFVIK